MRRQPSPELVTASRVDRRAFLGGVAATTGLVALATAGATVGPLSPLSALAQRIPDEGPQGVPINKSAAAARVKDEATSEDYRLTIEGAIPTALFTNVRRLTPFPSNGCVMFSSWM